jgi:Uracil phosphoribosyltransferase
VSVTVVDHALAGHLLAQLRSQETAPPVFRTLAKRLALTLALEAIRDLPTTEITVRTPLEETTGRCSTTSSPCRSCARGSGCWRR